MRLCLRGSRGKNRLYRCLFATEASHHAASKIFNFVAQQTDSSESRESGILLKRKVEDDGVLVFDHDLAFICRQEPWYASRVNEGVPLVAEVHRSATCAHPTSPLGWIERLANRSRPVIVDWMYPTTRHRG